VVVFVAGAGVTTVDRVTVVVVVGTGVTASSCSHAPKALTLTAKSASLQMPIRFFMYPVRVRQHIRLHVGCFETELAAQRAKFDAFLQSILTSAQRETLVALQQENNA
jgi:hypothetical protein